MKVNIRTDKESYLIRLARVLKSDSLAVAACILGTLLQSFHTYYIVVYSSNLEENWQVQLQAIGMGLFFSFSLLVYTLRAGSLPKNSRDSVSKKMIYMRYVNGLFTFEWLVNSHYWTREFIIMPLNQDIKIEYISWYDWGVAMIIGFALPWMIKTYAGHINLTELEGF